jgi:hypothetical protein
MIVLRETPTEFLLSIPMQQRERAKKIEGRAWNGQRKAWVYKRTRRALDELLLEFGDELIIEAPNVVRLLERGQPQSAPDIVEEVTLEVAPSAVDEGQVAAAKEHERAEQRIEDMLRQLQGKLDELHERNVVDATSSVPSDHELQGRLAEKTLELEEARQQIHRLEAELQTSRSRLNKNADIDEALLAVVQVMFPSDANISAIARSVLHNNDLPVTLARKLELDLRAMFQEYGMASFHELINRAGEANYLSQEGIDLAHSIRKQRNMALHDANRPDASVKSARLARNLFCLSAMRLVLRELGRKQA